MQFVCNRDDLLEAVNTVTKAMAARTSIPLIEGIRLKGEAGKLELFCTDLKLSIKCTINADFEGAFACVMPGKLFSEVVRRLPDDDVEIDLEEANEGSFKVTILCRDSRTTLTALDATDFPETPEVPDENAVEIEERVLRAMIRQTSFAVAQDSTRPIFTGELIEIEDGQMNVVALDGFKFALRSCEVDPRRSAFSFQVSRGLCLSADAIQGQYLLISLRPGDRANGQYHMEFSSAVCVCSSVHIDVLVRQRPVAALRQKFIGIAARDRTPLCVERCSGSAAYRLQEGRFIHIHYLQQIRCGELLATGDVVQIHIVLAHIGIPTAGDDQRQDILILI